MRGGLGPDRIVRGCERAARTIQGPLVGDGFSAAIAAGSKGGSTIAKLVVAGSASGRATAPSSFNFTTRARGTSGG